eukprot:15259754-Alexandrium_andersonii.AAC.1
MPKPAERSMPCAELRAFWSWAAVQLKVAEMAMWRLVPSRAACFRLDATFSSSAGPMAFNGPACHRPLGLVPDARCAR